MARRNPVSMYELGKGAALSTYKEDRQRAWGGLSKRAARNAIDALAEVDEVDYPVTPEAIEEFRRGVRDVVGQGQKTSRTSARYTPSVGDQVVVRKHEKFSNVIGEVRSVNEGSSWVFIPYGSSARVASSPNEGSALWVPNSQIRKLKSTERRMWAPNEHWRPQIAVKKT